MGTLMAIPLEKEFQYYLKNQAELVRKYDGKFVVIKNREVIGVYTDEMEAIMETQKTEELGTFLVQRVAPGSAAHTQVFHSRVGSK
jgi:hypothetical protein